jgi:xanthine dehydrogenase small subunit
MRDHVLLHINGVPHRIGGADVFQTLSRFLRYEERATGTKIVCEEGDCGACTVLVGRPENGVLRYRPVNSCIQMLFQLDCTHVVTVEGLGRSGSLTPLQDAMVQCHGAQCGYCTPGFFERTEAPSADEARDAVTGNLCRCTGYEPIVRAAVSAKSQPRVEELFSSAPILQAIESAAREPVRVENFARPVTLDEAVAFKAGHPNTVVVQGGTDFGVWRTKRGFVPEAVLSLDGIEGLDRIETGEREGARVLFVGGRAKLAQFEEAARALVPELAPIMDRFGSPQIKNAGTLAGNIANASPIADSLPFLFVSEAWLELTGVAGTRVVPIASFYLGYKKLDLRPDEIITRIAIPLPPADEVLRLYKVSKRSHLDISTFTAALRMKRSGGRIESIRIAYGGVAPVVVRLRETESFLAGRSCELETFAAAAEIARGEIAPITDVRGTREHRLQLASNILSRFYYDTCT